MQALLVCGMLLAEGLLVPFEASEGSPRPPGLFHNERRLFTIQPFGAASSARGPSGSASGGAGGHRANATVIARKAPGWQSTTALQRVGAAEDAGAGADASSGFVGCAAPSELLQLPPRELSARLRAITLAMHRLNSLLTLNTISPFHSSSGFEPLLAIHL